jgi:CDP-glucose 4,6-dehydratase
MLLSLSIEKAESSLGWRPVWDFSRTIEKTMVWYRSFTQDGQSALSLTRSQIREYCADARLAGLAWTA